MTTTPLQVPALPATPLPDLKIEEVRRYRNELSDEENKVSYWRRLVQHRLNLIAKEKAEGHLKIEDLIRALGETGTGARRQQLLTVEAAEELPQLPGLDDLWTQTIDLKDTEATERLVAELSVAEVQLSAYRRGLHERIDAATAELVSRYKADPSLSLSLLPVGAR